MKLKLDIGDIDPKLIEGNKKLRILKWNHTDKPLEMAKITKAEFENPEGEKVKLGKQEDGFMVDLSDTSYDTECYHRLEGHLEAGLIGTILERDGNTITKFKLLGVSIYPKPMK